MKHPKKKIAPLVCLILCFGVSTWISSECISLEMLDGSVSVGCGAVFVGAGLGIVFLPGCWCHAFAQQTGSTFLGLCACASYLSGIIMAAGGIKILYDGIKKIFGFNRHLKTRLYPHYDMRWTLIRSEPSWIH